MADKYPRQTIVLMMTITASVRGRFILSRVTMGPPMSGPSVHDTPNITPTSPHTSLPLSSFCLLTSLSLHLAHNRLITVFRSRLKTNLFQKSLPRCLSGCLWPAFAELDLDRTYCVLAFCFSLFSVFILCMVTWLHKTDHTASFFTVYHIASYALVRPFCFYCWIRNIR